MYKYSFLYPTCLLAFQVVQDTNLGPLAGIISSLGSAGAAVIVMIYFLSYVRDQQKTISELRESVMKMQASYQNSLEDMARRFIKRQEDLQDFFENQLQKITTSQMDILRETITTVKGFEKALSEIKGEINLVLIKVKSSEEIEPNKQRSIEK